MVRSGVHRVCATSLRAHAVRRHAAGAPRRPGRRAPRRRRGPRPAARRDAAELDVAVEGDTTAAAARALGGLPLRHERFGTATVRVGRLPDRRRDDARRALPVARRAARGAPGRARPRTSGAATSPSTRIALDLADGRLREAPGAQEDLRRGPAARAARRVVPSTTRRACGASPATAPGWASRSSRTPRAGPRGGRGGALATVCGDAHRQRAAPRARRARPGRGAGERRASSGWRRGWTSTARRSQRALGAARRRRRPRAHACWRRVADATCRTPGLHARPGADRSRAARGAAPASTRRPRAPSSRPRCAARRSRPSRSPARAGRRRRGAGSRRTAIAGWRSAATTSWRPGVPRPGARRAACWPRATRVLDGRVGDDRRRAARRRPGGRLALRRVFEWDGDHLAIRLGDARVLFTTRRGGVSEGPFASLNLGERTADDPPAVEANHARLRELAGGATLARCSQVHGRDVVRRTTPPDGERPQADGVATNVAGVARGRPDRRLPAGRAQRAGRRGDGARRLARPRRRRARRGRRRAARRRRRPVRSPPRSAPAPEAAATRSATRCARRFADVPEAMLGRNVDLKAVAAARLRAAGVEEVHDGGLCTMCDAALLLAPPRPRHHRPAGRRRVADVAGRRASGSPRPPRARGATPATSRSSRRRSTSPLEDLGALADAGITRVGENRAQDLQAKHAAYGDRFTWDFIGHVQSRKVPQILPLVQRIHSVGSDSVLAQPRAPRDSRARVRDPRRGQRRAARRARAASTPTSSARSSSAARSRRSPAS